MPTSVFPQWTMKKMKETVLPFPAQINQTIFSAKGNERRRILCTAFVIFAATAGFLLIAAGFIVSFLAWLETDFYQAANSRLGGFLLLAAFQMFFLAAHALDKSAFYKRCEKTSLPVRRKSSLKDSK